VTAIPGVGPVLLLFAFALGLGACGGKKNPSGPSSGEDSAFLFEHNARENDGQTVRWPNLPIPVFLNGIALESEVSEWTSATGGKVTFTFVGSTPGSGITFRFGGGADICAVTTIEFRVPDGVILSADVRVVPEEFRGPRCVRTITHETAHAIGFFGHTSDGGLMDDDGGNGSITSPVSGMLRNLYSLAPGTPVGLAEKPRTAQRPSGGRRTATFVYPVRQ